MITVEQFSEQYITIHESIYKPQHALEIAGLLLLDDGERIEAAAQIVKLVEDMQSKHDNALADLKKKLK